MYIHRTLEKIKKMLWKIQIVTISKNGVKCVRNNYQIKNSIAEFLLFITKGRQDSETVVEWMERDKVLKLPSTSKFEVVGHQWADLSENGFPNSK